MMLIIIKERKSIGNNKQERLTLREPFLLQNILISTRVLNLFNPINLWLKKKVIMLFFK